MSASHSLKILNNKFLRIIYVNSALKIKIFDF